MEQDLTLSLQTQREGEPIPLSALQHAVYCLRQAALIHLERLWAENRYTAEGNVLHSVVDKGGARKVRGVRRLQALPLASKRLNLVGFADMVEFLPSKDGEQPFPVEYKRGKPKLHRADEVQLCAQALCLEEMLGVTVPQGALFYAETKRRVVVPFDEDLRSLTEQTIHAVGQMFASLQTPQAIYKADRCRACSLSDLCRPKLSGKSVLNWREKQLAQIMSAPVEDAYGTHL